MARRFARPILHTPFRPQLDYKLPEDFSEAYSEVSITLSPVKDAYALSAIACRLFASQPRHLLLHVVETHDGDSFESLARAHLASPARVVSDGLGCLRSGKRAGSTHEPVNVTKASDQGEKLVFFRWVKTLLNNLKTVVAGILKLVRRHYVARYLVAFQYRFNDRFDLKSIFRRLAFARTKAARYPTRTFVLCTKRVHQAYMGKAQARTTS